MNEPRGEAEQLPDDWSARDSHDCFYEYIAICREEVRAGRRELPAMFIPRERAAG